MFVLAAVLSFLASTHAVEAFTCPDDSHSFYHADVSTGCQVYHLCENSQLQTLTCSSGQAFNHETSRCEDASTVNCVETIEQHAHHLHKRDVAEVHTFNIQEVKNKLVDAYHAFKPVLTEIAKDIFPTIYSKFQEDYLPALKATREELLPFLRAKVYPQVMKWAKYAFKIVGKVVEKLYKSYHMSNSTHVSIVSMSDIIDEVTQDLKPIVKLGKYLASKMMKPQSQHVRQKRETHMPDLLYSIMSPMINNALGYVTDSFFGNANTISSKILLPVIYDMMADEETRYDVLRVVISAKSAFTPFAMEMINRQSFNTPRGTVIQIPRHHFETAYNEFLTKTKPVLRKLALKYLPQVFRLSSQNVPLILDSVDNLAFAKNKHGAVLRDEITMFMNKHSTLFQSSNATHINVYTLTEIMNDLRPMKMTLLHMFVDYSRQNPDSLINKIFGENSALQSMLAPAPVYAQMKTTAATSAPRVNRYIKIIPIRYRRY